VNANIDLGPPTTYPRPNKWWDLSCGIHHLGFIVWDFSLLSCFCQHLLIVALVPFVFGFSMHLLGYHRPLSYGCAIFECGGVLVSTRSTLTTLVTHVLSSCSRYGTMGH
jgi:hypothetical protein